MRPLRLEIEGLTSFREKQKIDFSNLDLFVITGPTGSGKSSILDAIALALYGRAPRMGGQGNSQLVSHGLALARILFEFEAQGVAYRIARRLPHNGAQTAALERQDDGEWLPEVLDGGVQPVNRRLVEVLGLDFEAFQRTVLLPQGDFAAFLSGDPPERRRILIRLLDLGRYQDAARIAGTRATNLAAEAGAAEHQIAAQYKGIDEAALADANAKRAAADAAHAEAVEARVALEALAGDLADAARQLSDLQAMDRELAAAQQRIARLSDDFAAIEPDQTAARAAATKAAAKCEGAARRRDEAAGALQETLRLTGGDARLADLDAALRTCAHEDTQLQQLYERRTGVEAEVSLRAHELDAANAALAEARAAEEAAAEADTAAQERREAARAGRDAAAERDRAVREAAEAEAELAAALPARETAAAAAAAAEADETVARTHRDHLKAENEAAAFRTHLGVGEPCPVCRQIVGAIPIAEADLEASIAEAERALRAASSRHREAIAAAASAKARHGEAVRRAVGARARLAEAPAAPSLDEAEGLWRGAADGAAETAGRLRERADATADAGRKQLGAHGAHATAAAGLSGLDGEIASANARRSAAWATIEAGFPGASHAAVAEEVRVRRQRVAEARSADAAARTAFDDAHQAVTEAEAAVAAVAGRAATIGAAAMEERGTLGQLLARSAVLVALPPLPAPQDRIGEGLRDLSAFVAQYGDIIAEAVRATTGRRADLEARLAGALAARGLNPRSLGEVHVRAAVADFVTDAALRRQAAENAAARIAADLATKARLEGEAAEKRKAAVLHQTLANALQANNFIDFILAESVQRLAAAASTELKSISAGRYSLRAQNIGFVVVDHANADEQRSVSTLSGGETFLASLALATALARSITDIAGVALGARLEAMFIDEGFGTLDPEALDMVVEALERLRDTDRMVGIITHVPALAERIPDGLAVERAGNASKVVARS